MKNELLKLYKEYCDYVDADNDHYTDHEYYKGSLELFMEWAEKGFISDLN